MNRKLVLLMVFALIDPLTAHAMTAGELAAKLQAQYDKTKDLKASFTQTSEVKAMHITRESSGTLLIKKPGLLRYTYTKPDRQEFIVRGEDLIMYMPDQNQVITKKMDRAFMDRTPSTFLAGLGKITDSFDVSIPPNDKSLPDTLLLALTPRGDNMGVKEITLLLNANTYDIIGYTFMDINGNSNVTRLYDIKKNTGLKDSLFEFKIPKGASIIAQ